MIFHKNFAHEIFSKKKLNVVLLPANVSFNVKTKHTETIIAIIVKDVIFTYVIWTTLRTHAATKCNGELKEFNTLKVSLKVGI